MTEVRRPAPPQPPRERWRRALRSLTARPNSSEAPIGAAVRERASIIPSGRSARGLARAAPDGARGDARGAAVWGVLISLGAVLLVVGAVLGFGAWRGRSAVPLDDQLPYLLGTSGEEAQAGAEDLARSAGGTAAAVTTPPDDGQPTSNEPASNEPTSNEPAPPATGTDPPEPGSGSATSDPVDAPVVVHVSGAVGDPGVVELRGASRVHHAVAAAGGATAAADLDRVNLAALLVDGERIHVPELGDGDVPQVVAPSRSPVPVASPEQASDAVVPVDINRATTTELERLPGVGPSIARAILDLRTARGPYASIDELLLVGGIGPAKLETLRPHAYVTASG